MQNNQKDKYNLGVIGGMGPLATAYFFDQIVTHTKAENDNEHINFVVLNHASMISRVDATFDEKKKIEFLRQIKKDFEILENIGVNYVAIPCNGAHSFFEELEKMTYLNILNMPKEAVQNILKKNQKVKKVGILGTDATIKNKVYENELLKNNLEAIYPDKYYQKEVMSIIYDEIKKDGSLNIDRLVKVINHLEKKGVDIIILACTELSLFKNYYEVKNICVDAMDALVRKCIEVSNKEYIQPIYDYSIRSFLRKIIRIVKLKIKKSLK